MGLELELQLACESQEIPDVATFQHWLNVCFMDANDATVLVRIVDETESAELNQQFRDKVGPTNVLSFPFETPPEIPDDHLGDLVICAPLIAAEAKEQGKRAADHWAHMLVHGVLHLQGYDHLIETEAKEMEALEIHLLSGLGIANPYK
ncbi:MAG TPA: rRNA maturation RNase YbeY [Chromatiales bacterium]|nr:rRNA maturation RNase YbeY [Thiotrichales bacterium]HIP69731.1 rRNA maturation RNase YbeY [Chromatiales bacterium]